MKIDKEKLDALVAMSDDELWRQIVEIGRSHGFTLPAKTPPHSEMEKMRGAVKGGAKLNLNEAIRVINNYRKSSNG